MTRNMTMETVNIRLAAAENLLLSAKPSDGPMVSVILDSIRDSIRYIMEYPNGWDIEELEGLTKEKWDFITYASRELGFGKYNKLPMFRCDWLEDRGIRSEIDRLPDRI